MKAESLERYLNSFGQQVVRDSKQLLKSAKGNTTLGNSIKFKVVATDKGYDTMFFMEDYGTYLDKGVSGNKKPQSFIDYKGKTIKSSYSYTTKGPPIDILSKWIKKKGIKGRDKKSGRFISHLSLAFIIGRSIKRDGIKSLSFFQKPLGLGMKEFGKDLLGAIAEDITDSISQTKVN